ncbi:MAG: ATPase [Deltaproteobacteria bacterium]|nr:MAG: ATPase [Deltaproteobacteria bacterium]
MSTSTGHFLRAVELESFRSFRKASVPLGPLTVLVGPNGAGKSNFLMVIRFLSATARLDLEEAIQLFGGFERLCFRGTAARRPRFRIHLKASVTRYASDSALDEYTLRVEQYPNRIARFEEFKFKRYQGRGRRIAVQGAGFSVDDGRGERHHALARSATALSTLPRLGNDHGGEQVRQLAELLTSFRVVDINVAHARTPARRSQDGAFLQPDGSNLASFIEYLSNRHPQAFRQLQDDMRYVVPGFRKLELSPIGGAAEGLEIRIVEKGLPRSTPLADASYGSVRALALLAILHDPSPPQLTCIEEVDHGLHPHAMDRLVERFREATARTQLLLATHSPSLVNRLEPSELLVCERDPDTGESLLPAVDPHDVVRMREATDLGLGELWFSGALGGGLP